MRAACGCDTFRVEWTGLDGLRSIDSGVDSITAAFEDLPRTASGRDSCPDRVTVRLRARVHGERREFLVSGRPLCLGTAWMAVRAVRSGALIQDEDLGLRAGWFPPSALTGGAPAVLGTFVLRNLARGQWVVRGDLRDPPLVRRGERLHVLYQAGGLRVEGDGVSRRDGWAGDVLPVRLVGSDHDCDGVVMGRNEVRVGGAE